MASAAWRVPADGQILPNITDEAGNTRVYCPDGLGRLAWVAEADGSKTQYTYDARNNLTSVNQGDQWRRFEYSSLNRLTAACNPESATTATASDGSTPCTATPLPSSGLDRYNYDANGNLTSHTDARGVTTTFSEYDHLNRLKGKSYSDGTPSVTYIYDQDFKGALSSVTTASTAVSDTNTVRSYRHDGFGRLDGSSQTIGSSGPYSFSYGYTLTDQLRWIQYPSGRKVTYGIDSAGRVTSVTGTMGAVSTPYAPSVTYTAASGMDSLSLNNGALIETYNWNDRQQLTGITAGTLLAMRFYPCDNGNEQCASGNNGKIWRETIAAGGSTAVQEYRYDTLNRLTLAAEKATTSGFTPMCPDAGSVWCYQFGYDTWGNRTIQQRSPASSSSWDAGSFHAKTNRIVDTSTDQTQWVYDAAGNLIQHGTQIFKYDAENAQVAQCTTSIASCVVQAGAGTLYVYDGEGNRVQRIGQDGTRTTYVYDALGNLAAEYGASVTATGTQYVTADHLGSTRLVTGSQTTRHDYEPYGAELNLSGTWRSGVSGYGAASGVRQMFTGQERDSGTLDYFIARYYIPDQGRFMSVDPGNAGANPADPQSWNGYAYVSNNPLMYTDPSGMMSCATCVTSSGGPVGTVIGAVIDIGAALWGIFGGGGHSPNLGHLTDSVSATAQGSVDVSGLSGGWWSQCGFLYGTVCGVGPASAFNISLRIDPTGGLMPVFRAQGTGKMPKDPPPQRRSGELEDRAKLVFSQVYKTAAPVKNPCFWGTWTLASGVAGAGGAVVANSGDLAGLAVETAAEKSGYLVPWAYWMWFRAGAGTAPKPSMLALPGAFLDSALPATLAWCEQQ